MAQTRAILRSLKQCLKSRGVTYRELAKRLGLSEASIKRLFSDESFSLKRLDEICTSVGLEISDVVEMATQSESPITQLTDEQERVLLANTRLLLMTYLLVNNWPLDQITKTFAIDRPDLMKLLYRLNRLRIIEVQPGDRIKKLTARNFSWRKDGPVQLFFKDRVQSEFFSVPFDRPGEQMSFVGGMLTRTSVMALQRRIDSLAREFDDLCQSDAAMPIDEKFGVSAVLAIRPWEFTGFTRLRRDPDATRKKFGGAS